MIKQNWDILEEEKNRILNLHEDATKKHYLLKEQNESKTETQTVPLNTNWGSGKWRLTANQTNALTQQLNKITNFINQHRGSKVTIQIRAGESRVTNYDREVTPKEKLDPGVLSERRGSSLVEFLKGYFETLLKKGLISEMPNIPKSLSVIGNTPYTDAKDLNDATKVAKYNAEQFVEAIISVEKKYDCVVGMQITIGYLEEKGQKNHQCDEAIFELKLNGVSLGEVNLNNSKMDYGLNVRDRSIEREKDKYQKKIQKLEKDWKSLVSLGQVKDNEKEKRKYFDQYLPTPPEQMEYPGWVEGKAQEKGYKDINKFVNDLKTINNSFEKYGRPKYYNSGSRSQTFTIDGPLAQKIVSNTNANKLVLSIVPLVSPDGKYSIFYEKGTHSDTPWVIIQTKDSKEPIYNQPPNVDMKRGDLKEKVILETDLCGNKIKKP